MSRRSDEKEYERSLTLGPGLATINDPPRAPAGPQRRPALPGRGALVLWVTFLVGLSLGGVLGRASAPSIPPRVTPGFTPTPGQPTPVAARSAGTSPASPINPTWTARPTPGAARSAGTPCPILPADNIWNRNIRTLPTAARSDAYIDALGSSNPLHAGFGACCWRGAGFGQPYVVVTAVPPQPVRFKAYGEESDPGPYPIPTNAPIQGCATCPGDRHVLVVDQDTCTLYELYHAYPQADGSWEADQGSVFPLLSNALRPDGWTSADAAGLPLFPGLVRYDEVRAGAIRHALRFTTQAHHVSTTWTWPARHSDGQQSGPDGVPMGSRFRLKAAVDITRFDPQVQVILQALKDYGMILADSDPGEAQLDLDGAADDRWSNDLLGTLRQLHTADFEVVDVSGLKIDPDSGQSR